MRDFLKVGRAQEKLRFTPAEIVAFDRDGWRCHYCGSEGPLTADHVVPQVFGGGHEESNLVCACRTCNVSRGKKPYEDFKEDISAWLVCFAVSGLAEW